MNRLSDEEAQRILRETQQNDGTTPLKYEGGYVHERCGSDAEKALAPNLSAACVRCGVVPSREVVKA